MPDSTQMFRALPSESPLDMPVQDFHAAPNMAGRGRTLLPLRGILCCVDWLLLAQPCC